MLNNIFAKAVSISHVLVVSSQSIRVLLLIGLLQISTITLASMTTHRSLMKLSLLSLTCAASVFKKKNQFDI